MQFSKLALAALSIGSAVAAPTPAPAVEKRDYSASSVLSVVINVKGTVEAELSSIESIAENVVDEKVLPVVFTALSNIASEVNGTIATIVPQVTDTVFPLVEEELENVPVLLTEVKGLVSDIESTVNELLAAVTGDVLAAVKPEVKNVIVLVEPLLAPVLTLAHGLINTATGPVVSNVTVLISDIETIVGGILSPVEGLLSKVL
ncbi:hypothetical protein BJ170DRAFT_484910 [Xylariales sp. AK1849]|nr:hypothetical protein BJ170DRAFT_484910 [Xylariales sp. AK1849]